MDLPVSHTFIAEAASYWDAVPCGRLPASNHLLYEVKANDTRRIMRLTDASHRTQTYILAEIHWINFLAGKANVARAIASTNDRWTIPVHVNGKEMTACVFEKIKGRPINKDDAWGSEVFFEWGKAMAGLHELSRKYVPDNDSIRHLNGEVLLAMAAATPGCGGYVYKILEEKWKQLSTSVHPQDWGMIHCDVTQANMRYHNNKLHIFDFDNCQYAPFLYDIASTVYVTLFSRTRKETHDFLQHFFAGYSLHSKLKIDAAALRCALDFFNALIYIACKLATHHPFEKYAQHNLQHGTLAGINFEKYLP